ncbi:acyl carrier protein [bacterium]|nr:acyl carrier protein [bacterium]
MKHSEIQSRVKKVISEIIEIDAASIPDNANFIFDLGADSVQSVSLVAAFEEEFDIEMDEDKALEIQTVSDAVEFIAGYL